MFAVHSVWLAITSSDSGRQTGVEMGRIQGWERLLRLCAWGARIIMCTSSTFYGVYALHVYTLCTWPVYVYSGSLSRQSPIVSVPGCQASLSVHCMFGVQTAAMIQSPEIGPLLRQPSPSTPPSPPPFYPTLLPLVPPSHVTFVYMQVSLSQWSSVENKTLLNPEEKYVQKSVDIWS